MSNICPYYTSLLVSNTKHSRILSKRKKNRGICTTRTLICKHQLLTVAIHVTSAYSRNNTISFKILRIKLILELIYNIMKAFYQLTKEEVLQHLKTSSSGLNND